MLKVSNLLIALLCFVFNSSAQSKDDSLANNLNNKGLQFMMKDKQDSALIMYDSAVKADPAYYTAYTNKCSLYCGLKDFKNALIAIKKAIEIKPDLAEAWTFAGMISDHIGDSAGASKFYLHSLEIYNARIANPGKKKYLKANKLNRAISYILLGEKEKGESELKQLKAEYPSDSSLDEILNVTKEEYLKEIFR